MTNHIEQLMKAAGVKPVILTDCSFINIKKGYEIGTDCCPACEDERLKCEDCEHSKLTKRLYPAFTPEKQLELIKLIAQEDRGFHSVHFSEWTCESCHSIYDRSYFLEWAAGATFEEALARLLILLIKQKHLKKRK